MPWYCYVCAFFAGAFLANAAPHFVKGICGESFPTPFGRGLSSPVVNVLWGLLNLIVGLCLFYTGELHHHPHATTLILFFAGMLALSLLLSFTFGKHPH